MSFHPAHTLGDAPDITFLITGLVFIVPATDGSSCRLLPHRSSDAHYFSIEIREKSPNPRIPDFIVMRHVGPIEEPGMVFTVEPNTNEGVQQFLDPISPLTTEFNRENLDANPRDFRWAIDLENEEFHDRPLTLKSESTEPGISVSDGVFFTANRSDEDNLPITRTGGSKETKNLHRVASIIGSNLYLKPNSAIRIKWNENGLAKELLLQKPPFVAGTRYEVYIDNEPLYVDLFDENDVSRTHQEMTEYYKAVADVADSDQFGLVFEGRHLGSPNIPCMPVRGGTGKQT